MKTIVDYLFRIKNIQLNTWKVQTKVLQTISTVLILSYLNVKMIEESDEEQQIEEVRGNYVCQLKFLVVKIKNHFHVKLV